MTRIKALLGSTLVSLVLACGGTAKIGESCETAGNAEQCESGAVCTNTSSATFTCRKSCTEQSQCGSNENCNGISGSSIKSCQPK